MCPRPGVLPAFAPLLRFSFFFFLSVPVHSSGARPSPRPGWWWCYKKNRCVAPPAALRVLSCVRLKLLKKPPVAVLFCVFVRATHQAHQADAPARPPVSFVAVVEPLPLLASLYSLTPRTHTHTHKHQKIVRSLVPSLAPCSRRPGSEKRKGKQRPSFGCPPWLSSTAVLAVDPRPHALVGVSSSSSSSLSSPPFLACPLHLVQKVLSF